MLKRAALYKNTMRYPLNVQELMGKELNSGTGIGAGSSSSNTTINFGKRNSFGSRTDSANKSNDTVPSATIAIPDDDGGDADDRDLSAESPIEEILLKRADTYFKENFRYHPMNSCTETTSSTSQKEKSSSSSTSSSPSPMLKPVPESSLLQDCSSIEEETKCVVCNANFPSVWLLEQHAALQHANLGPMEEKPFICEQCGQSYRYRSAYVKHREQNHRARLPADKLFTCDVCGMQFRYLKSFKKHRLNHALERLHGKCEKRAQQLAAAAAAAANANNTGENNNELVSSSNEALTDEIAELQYAIKAEDDEEEQDDTIDSPTASGAVAAEMKNLPQTFGSGVNAALGGGGNRPASRISRGDSITATSPSMLDESNFILKVCTIDPDPDPSQIPFFICCCYVCCFVSI